MLELYDRDLRVIFENELILDDIMCTLNRLPLLMTPSCSSGYNQFYCVHFLSFEQQTSSTYVRDFFLLCECVIPILTTYFVENATQMVGYRPIYFF